MTEGRRPRLPSFFYFLLPWAKAFLAALLMHMEETVAPESTDEESNDVAEEEYETIDDVISECTGEIENEVKEEKKPTKKKEPWYLSRAKRIADYYNW